VFFFGLSLINGLGWQTAFIAAAAAILAFAISRLGLLAVVAMLFVFHLHLFHPMAFDTTAWYFGEGMVALSGMLLPAAVGAWIAASRRTQLARDLC
jgi:hypothetical protein